jgi:hypothetical protein
MPLRVAIRLPQGLGRGELRLQAGNQSVRQHEGTVLRALALAHDQRAVREVHVLHPQVQRLGDAHACAVQQHGEQPQRRLVELSQQTRHLLCGQHHRQVPLDDRPHQLPQPGQVHPQHAPVEEQQRRQRLPMRGRRHRTLHRQMREVGFHLGLTHEPRMAHAMKAHVVAHPQHVHLLGTPTEVHQARHPAHFVKQPGRGRRRPRRRVQRARRRAGCRQVVIHGREAVCIYSTRRRANVQATFEAIRQVDDPELVLLCGGVMRHTAAHKQVRRH